MINTRTYEKGDNIEKYGYNPPTLNIDKALFDTIMKEVKQTSNEIEFAIELYKALNKRVAYDELFTAFKSDYNFIKNKNLSDVTLENNEVICTSWAELYAALLNKNNIKAVVSGVVHCYVIFYADGHFIKADATENIVNEKDSSRLTDLARARLNIRPHNLLIYEKDDNNNIAAVEYYDSKYYQTHSKEEQSEHFLNYTTKLLNLLKENKTYKEYKTNPLNFKKIMEKISEILYSHDLAPVEEMMYINNLLYLYLSDEEYKRLSKDYLKIYKDNKLICGLLLTCSQKEDLENPRVYDFHPPVNGQNYLYTKANKLIPITEDEAYNLQVQNDEIEMDEEKYLELIGGHK